jgi:hypothetical protein
MNSLGENKFCETNVKEGAKRTNDSLSFLFGFISKDIYYSKDLNYGRL